MALLIAVSGMLLCEMVQSQSITPQSVNSCGATLIQSSGTLSYVLGELAALKQTDAQGNTIWSGFINGAVISTSVVSVVEPDPELLNVKVYPNPTSELVFVDISDTRLNWIYLELYEMQGKLISKERYAGINNRIGLNIAAINSGTYLLNIKDENGKLLGTYKLLKD